MAAPTDHQHAAFRRPPPTSPRGRPTPKRSRSDTGPRDNADNSSFISNKRRQFSREEHVPGRGIDNHGIGPRNYPGYDSHHHPDDGDDSGSRTYLKSYDSHHSDDDDDDDDDSKASGPIRLGSHRVLPPTGLQIRGGASAHQNGPHPGIKQEPEQYDGPEPPPSLWGLLDRDDNDIFWNLPSQFHGPFENIIKKLDNFRPHLEFSQGPKYAGAATTQTYRDLRHLAGITHSLNNRKGPPQVIKDLRHQLADAREKNEKLSGEIRALQQEADIANIKKDREAMAREAIIRTAHKAELTSKTAELVARVERLEREVQAEKDDKAKLLASVERLEKEAQAERDDKAKLAASVERLEKEAQIMKDDKAKLEAVAEQTAKERHTLAIQLKEQTERDEREKTSLRQQLDGKGASSNSEVSGLRNTVKQLRDGKDKQIEDLKNQARVLTREGDSLKYRIRTLTGEKENLNDTISSLASEKQGFKNQTLVFLGKIEGLTGDKESLVKENKNLAGEKDNLAKENKNLAGEKDNLARENKGLNVQVMVLNQSKQVLLGRINTLVEENKGLAGEKDTLAKENNGLNDQVLALTKTKEKYIATVNNLTDERNSLAKLLAQKDVEIQALRTSTRSSAAQQRVEHARDTLEPSRHAGEPGGSAGESSPYIKQEARHFQLPTPTASRGPGFPRPATRAISIDTLPSPRTGPGGEMQTMVLPTPDSGSLTQSAHRLNERLSSMLEKILGWNLGRGRVVIGFVTNLILSSVAADTPRPAVTQAKGHWEVRDPWIAGEALELQTKIRQAVGTSVEEQFVRLCVLVENLRNQEQKPHLLIAAIPTLASSLMKADYTSSSAAALAFLETMRSLAPPPPAGENASNAQRAALALVICELCRVLEKSLPDAKRSIWKIGSILGPEAQAAAETLPIGNLADILSYGSSAHLTKTHLAAECGGGFCLMPVPADGSPDREIGLLYPAGDSREGECESQYFLMMDFADLSFRLVDCELADMKDMRASKADALQYDFAISRDEGGREEELFHVTAAPKKVFMFWFNYIQGFK